ncbi:alpha/beta hydrolase [Filibacter tadaridae]|uniref:Lysophospholipase L2 n=2 Tax=Filibacter tadaridae TaxID=2483811 RepID=A0A3P5XLX4_9BACL|nr:lysophospholipase L2 [Filibacter tadaridae]
MTLEMSDGFSIHTVLVEPADKPIGHIHILHGMAEHIGRYEEFAKYLAGIGYIVSGHDHRGHGKTAEMNGKPGYFGIEKGFDRVVQDAYEIIKTIREQHPSPRFILFGHSMGSFIARRYVQVHGSEVDLAILSGTGGNPGVMRIAATGIAHLSGKMNGYDNPDPLLNKLVFGGFNKSIDTPKTPFDWLSRDSDAVEKYMNDPNCGFISTTQFFIDLFEGLEKIHSDEEIRKIPQNLPILLISGNEDPVGDNGKGVLSVAKQYDKVGIVDVTLMLVEGGRHELLNEINHQHVFEYITDWIEKK